MEIIQSLFFYIIAGIALLSALCVVFAPKIIYSAIALVATFLAIAGIFILLNADFVGLAQVMIYGVGVAIVLIFAIMLTSQKEEKNLWIAFAPRTLFALMFSFLLFVGICFASTKGFTALSEKSDSFYIKQPRSEIVKVLEEEGTSKALGKSIFTVNILAFEILSILLLAAILGSVVLARKDGETLKNPTTITTEEQEEI